MVKNLSVITGMFVIAMVSACQAEGQQADAQMSMLRITAISENGEAPEPEARIYLNDVSVGTGQVMMQVPTGEYTVRAELEGYPPQEEGVELAGGEQENVTFEFDE